MKQLLKFMLAMSMLSCLAVNSGLAFDRVVLFENFTSAT